MYVAVQWDGNSNESADEVYGCAISNESADNVYVAVQWDGNSNESADDVSRAIFLTRFGFRHWFSCSNKTGFKKNG